MIQDEYYRKVAIAIVFAVLIILSYFLLKPLLIAIIVGIFFAFLFLPLHNLIQKHTKSKNLSALLLCLLLLVLIIVPLWYLIPAVLDQSLGFFSQAQQLDFAGLFQKLFPSFPQSETLVKEIVPTISSFITKASDYFVHSISEFLLNIPTLFLQAVVMLFTFFFTLRDSENIMSYIKSLIPFSEDIKEKIFQSSRNITNSVIYGRIVLGIVQGLMVGIGYFIFKVPNALFLTVLSCIAGVLPIVGTIIIWLPVSIFLFASGNNLAAFGIIAFGLFTNFFESIIQPIVLAKMVKMNSSVMLIAMIGGLFMFGILGVIIGPLIIAYLLIVLEIYRDKRISKNPLEKDN